MCIAIAGRVQQIEENRAKVDCCGNSIHVAIDMVNCKTGDYVLVHAGCAIEVIDEKQAFEIQELYKLLEGACNE